MARIIIQALQRSPSSTEVSQWILAAEQQEDDEPETQSLTQAETEAWERLPKERQDFFSREARRLHTVPHGC